MWTAERIESVFAAASLAGIEPVHVLGNLQHVIREGTAVGAQNLMAAQCYLCRWTKGREPDRPGAVSERELVASLFEHLMTTHPPTVPSSRAKEGA